VFLALALAATPSIRAFPDTVQLDLDDGSFLSARRKGAASDLAPLEHRSPIRLHAAKDEVVAFQLLVEGSGTHAVWAAPIDGVQIDLFRAHPIRVTEPSRTPNIHSLGPAAYADALIPTATITLGDQGRAIVFVDLHVARDRPAGQAVTAIAIGDARVPVILDVLDVTVPLRDVARLGAINFGSLRARGKRDRSREVAWMQMAHAHHLTIEMMRPTPARLPDGSHHWEGWAEEIGPYVDGSAFTLHHGYRGPRAGQPVSRFILPHTDWWPSPKTDANLPSDPVAFAKALAEWEQLAMRRGWLDRENATEWVLFVNSLDEPRMPENITSLAAYERLIAGAHLERRDRIHFRIDGNFGQRIEGYDDEKMAEVLGPVADVWNVHGAPYTIPWSLLERRRKLFDEEVMVYFSNTSGEPAIPPTVVDAPLVALRAWGWLVVRYGLEGAVNWEVDFDAGCVTNPRCSPGGTLNLDANLIYRGHELGERVDQPIPSMRLKALRRGAQDAALLSLLADRDPKTAGQLAEVIVPRALGDDVPFEGFGAWPQDPLTYEKARYAILDRLTGNPDPLPLAKVRFDRPDPFEEKGGDIAMRLGLFALVLAVWFAAVRLRTRR
jgi:hypothetical protein